MGRSLNSSAREVAGFGILTALALVLGALDRAIPLSALLGGAVPGLKLGLANTVLLYAIYTMNIRSCFLLMAAKVALSGFLFGSLSAMLYSLAGGILSLLTMLLAKKKGSAGLLTGMAVCIACEFALLRRYATPRGQVLWSILVIAMAGLLILCVFLLLKRNAGMEVIGVSVVGAATHNLGQILTAAWILRTPQLLWSYLPFLLGLGAAVVCLTGIIAHRVMRALPKMRDVGRSA